MVSKTLLGLVLREVFFRSAMPRPTPVENERHTAETIDVVAPRLQRFTKDLIEHLQALNLDVRTTTHHLLDSPAYPIDVVAQVNDTHINMQFTASLPKWSVEARARLEVSFNRGKSKKFYERVDKTFNLVKVVKTFIAEVHAGDALFAANLELERKAKLAGDSFRQLAETLGIPYDPFNPLTLKHDNFRFRAVPETPSRVAVIALVTHEQAVEMMKRYHYKRAPKGSRPKE